MAAGNLDCFRFSFTSPRKVFPFFFPNWEAVKKNKCQKQWDMINEVTPPSSGPADMVQMTCPDCC